MKFTILAVLGYVIYLIDALFIGMVLYKLFSYPGSKKLLRKYAEKEDQSRCLRKWVVIVIILNLVIFLN